MTEINDALRAGLGGAPPAVWPALPHARHGAAAHRAVVVGGVGPLGSVVLEHLVSSGGFARVATPVWRPVAMALRGIEAWPLATLQQPPPAGHRADTGVVVFDREHHRHGREAAFVRPLPAELPLLGRWLQAAGVRRLVVVMPHAPALLPQALRAGLASLDEQALAGLGFDQLVIVRPARAPGQRAPQHDGLPTGGLHALAQGLLAQLGWMVPQREQALRPRKVAAFVTALVRALPAAATGTRVAPPELLWDWAQPGGDAALAAWLQHGQWQPPRATGRRW
jgi:hypothetical protein